MSIPLGLDSITPSQLASRLQDTIFGGRESIRHFDSIGSTNTVAMQAALQGAPEGSVFIAEEQLAGRGRGGHAWHSEAGGGIYLSAILRPRLEPQAALALSLVAGIAVHEALANVCRVVADLRWPNDVLLGNKKVAGILTESSADMQRMHHAVIGIGINVNQRAFPLELAHEATSLRIETGREWPRIELVIALLKSLDYQYRALQSETVEATALTIREFESRSSFVRGAMVAVHDRDAETTQYSGRTLGLDGRGFLKVQTESGLRRVLSGGIRKIAAAEDD
jgi:BirA family transcriptional regulator, biotin operon repressor / biotin---[acetyl-CoA-carboxylase] ligase